MRLDKFLKVSRLIKRRTVANENCWSMVVLRRLRSRLKSEILLKFSLVQEL